MKRRDRDDDDELEEFIATDDGGFVRAPKRYAERASCHNFRIIPKFSVISGMSVERKLHVNLNRPHPHPARTTRMMRCYLRHESK